MREGRTPGFTCKRQCTRCKKRFEIPNTINSWGWNIGEKLFCSYSCMRGYERERSQKRNHYVTRNRNG